MTMMDPSAYYLCLANASLGITAFATRRIIWEYNDSPEATKYYSMCLTHVTQRLNGDAKNVSEGLIGTILGLVCHNVSAFTFQ
jgi:hypothetical protein